MARGRPVDPQREKRGTGHRENVNESIVEYLPQAHSLALQSDIASTLPAGQPRETFLRAVSELGDKCRDTDLEALRLMAWHLHRALQAQELVDEHGLMSVTEYGMKANPMLKVARDESAAYMKIAEKYALTFESRLRAGVMQVAGQSMMQKLHEGMVDAIVARIEAS
jgi:hypothetical protein